MSLRKLSFGSTDAFGDRRITVRIEECSSTASSTGGTDPWEPALIPAVSSGLATTPTTATMPSPLAGIPRPDFSSSVRREASGDVCDSEVNQINFGSSWSSSFSLSSYGLTPERHNTASLTNASSPECRILVSPGVEKSIDPLVASLTLTSASAGLPASASSAITTTTGAIATALMTAPPNPKTQGVGAPPGAAPPNPTNRNTLGGAVTPIGISKTAYRKLALNAFYDGVMDGGNNSRPPSLARAIPPEAAQTQKQHHSVSLSISNVNSSPRLAGLRSSSAFGSPSTNPSCMLSLSASFAGAASGPSSPSSQFLRTMSMESMMSIFSERDIDVPTPYRTPQMTPVVSVNSFSDFLPELTDCPSLSDSQNHPHQPSFIPPLATSLSCSPAKTTQTTTTTTTSSSSACSASASSSVFMRSPLTVATEDELDDEVLLTGGGGGGGCFRRSPLTAPTVPGAMSPHEPALQSFSEENESMDGVAARPKPVLPILSAPSNPMFWSISPETVCNTLREAPDGVDVFVIDCRFPYEFEGGHIDGAVNFYRPMDAVTFLFETLRPDANPIIIFHCEFSQHRGPSIFRFVREWDRSINTYPNLRYPQMFLLEGGYSRFYAEMRDQAVCAPDSYLPMKSKEHLHDNRRYCKELSNLWKSLRRRKRVL